VTVSLPLVVVLGVIAWVATKFLGIRLWGAVAIALFLLPRPRRPHLCHQRQYQRRCSGSEWRTHL